MKQTINLKNAYKILRKCPVVEFEGRLLEIQLYDLEADPSNEFLSLSWTEKDEQSNEVNIIITFTEGDNKKCAIDGNVITLKSSEDKEDEDLTLYTPLFTEQISNSLFL